ncbi:cytidylate kinase family protein [Candidatus Bathyarchaeota archaeon]|nr:cytidylate kinase family protein [Candidatus Bathyarchaeota archaeon]
MGSAVMSPSQDQKKKIVLCISGMAGSGKSTLAKRIARKYKLSYLSGGDALKTLAMEAGFKPTDRGWWESEEGLRFLKKRREDLSFDKRADEKLLEWAMQGDVVLDSWAQAWLLKQGLKVWLEASTEERARRIAERDRITFDQASNALKEKDGMTQMIYKELYGFDLGEDFSPFDVVLDVTQLSEDEVFNTISLLVDRLLY